MNKGIDLDRLEALARAATEGEWQTSCLPLSDGPTDLVRGWTKVGVADCTTIVTASQRDAEHIAAANPQTVLCLVARLKAAEAVVEAARNVGWTQTPMDDDIAVLMDKLADYDKTLEAKE